MQIPAWFEEFRSPSVREEFHGWIGFHPLPLRDFTKHLNELDFPSANHGHGYFEAALADCF